LKMPRIPVVILSLLLSIFLSVSAQAQKHGKAHKIKAKAVQPEPQPQATMTPAPEPPPTPEKGPASPPEVSFEGGQLTIVARNSTMGDVLNAVKQKTGAAVEMPVISSERVVGRFGPGAPRDVMAQLLNGSHYNYVLIGSPADPGALNKVVLMARASGPEAAPQQQQDVTQSPNFQGNPNLQAVPEVENEQNPEETSGEVSPEVPQQEEAPPDQQGQQNGPVVKTPEQLLRELQQQQQQQQGQQQQDVPPGAPGQPPQ
jgi:hypothetical protein